MTKWFVIPQLPAGGYYEGVRVVVVCADDDDAAFRRASAFGLLRGESCACCGPRWACYAMYQVDSAEEGLEYARRNPAAQGVDDSCIRVINAGDVAPSDEDEWAIHYV
jgi:hypothetical protein